MEVAALVVAGPLEPEVAGPLLSLAAVVDAGPEEPEEPEDPEAEVCESPPPPEQAGRRRARAVAMRGSMASCTARDGIAPAARGPLRARGEGRAGSVLWSGG